MRRSEEKTLEDLIQKLKSMIPELLEANGLETGDETSFEPFSRRFAISQRSIA